MFLEQKIQIEVVRLLNKWSEGYETTLLKEFADWTNKNLISEYKITYVPDNYVEGRPMWILEKK